MIDFKVQPDGKDEYEVKATSRDIYLWEKTGRGRSFQRLTSDLHMEWMYEVAHIASRRQQLFTGSLDEFVNSCELHFEKEDTDEDPDPTWPEP